MEAIIGEAEALIGEAWTEGYRAGLLEAAPDAAYYKSLCESAQKELEEERGRFRVGLSGGMALAALSFIGGAFCYSLAGLK